MKVGLALPRCFIRRRRLVPGCTVLRWSIRMHRWMRLPKSVPTPSLKPEPRSALAAALDFWTLRPDTLIVVAGALPLLGDLLRYTIVPLLGWLQMPLLKWAMFSPAQVPPRFQAEYSPAMALRPSQIRATSMDGALMIPGALALRGGLPGSDSAGGYHRGRPR
jgi:hypothetical protein